MSDAELGSALLEVAAIGRAVGGRRDQVSVLSCDAAAGVAHPLCRAEGIPLIGGGGTDMRAGFARVLARSPRPDVVVVLTDGQDEDSRYAMSRQQFLAKLSGGHTAGQPVPVFGVGFGADADIATLQEMARLTGGQATAARDPADLAGAMARTFLAAHSAGPRVS